MKIKDIKDKFKKIDELRSIILDLQEAGNSADKINALRDEIDEIRSSIPSEFRANQSIDILKNQAQLNFLDPETLSLLKEVVSGFRKKAPLALDSFSDDMDSEEAIRRANKLRALE